MQQNFLLERKARPSADANDANYMDEQLKLAHKVVDVVNRPQRKICVILLQYNVDKPESLYAQVQLFARKEHEWIFQKIVNVNYRLTENLSIYLK